ncbi:hypothetical protein CJU89_5819 [Yarrowia sp. B02]|nr:hypothetical protein CJU89_5819 [Yarrowia sp. B02]
MSRKRQRTEEPEEESFDDGLEPWSPPIPYYMTRYGKQLMDTKDILPENRYMMDEVLFRGRGSAKASTMMVTSYEAVSASGRVLKPLVVVRKCQVKQEWLDKNIPHKDEYSFVFKDVKDSAALERAVQWFKDEFVPQTVPKNAQGEEDRSQWRLLVWRDVYTRDRSEVRELCKRHRIKIVNMPAEIAHFASPLECVLAPKVRKVLARHAKPARGEHYGHAFLRAFHQARTEGMAKEEVMAALEETGLWPVDSTKVCYLNDDRMPKQVRVKGQPM